MLQAALLYVSVIQSKCYAPSRIADPVVGGGVVIRNPVPVSGRLSELMLDVSLTHTPRGEKNIMHPSNEWMTLCDDA